MLSYEAAREKLERHGQAHVLGFWHKLNETARAALLSQVAELDFASVNRMRGMLNAAAAAPAGHDEPAPVLCLDEGERRAARAAGEQALRDGRVGVILVAGGQGSRLGFEGPKGAFSIGPVSGCSLFEIHAAKVAALETAYGSRVPFYIMTSRLNDGPTRAFFEEHEYFGLSAERVKFFTQGMWPALWPDGRIVMERPDRLFLSPDGHGGILSALRDGGMLADMAARGLQTLFYFQVDNPLVQVADPVFLGLHRARAIEMSLKVCAKRDPEEGLGVVVVRGGRQAIVEYTELTREQKHARRADGALRHSHGSVAIHAFSLAFLRREAAAELPVHLAHKKVPFCDADGATVQPGAPNAYKFEKFIFDVLPRADRALCLAFAREEEFSPVKNASGNDSAATAQRDMMRKCARWLAACGADVPMDEAGTPRHRIEIDPRYALDPEALRKRLPRGFRLERDTLLI